MTDTPGPGAPLDRPERGRFALVGVLATAVDVGLAVGLTEMGAGRLLADAIALVAAAYVSLKLHGRVTLRGDRLDRWIRRPKVFAAVALVAGTVDLVVFVGLSGLDPLGAKLVAVAAAASVRALTHRAVLFRAVSRVQSSPAARSTAPGGPRLSVVVPAYREAPRIGDTVRTLRADLADLDSVGDLEIVVVDDGSADGTDIAARDAGADRVVVQPENRGKGAAVRVGVAAAGGRTIAFTDADLAYPPRQLRPMLERVEAGWDVVIGDRRHGDTNTVRPTSGLRTLGSRAVNIASHLMLLGNYRDTQCGCKAFRSDAARAVMGAGTIDGFAFDIEVLHLVERYGLSLCEIPVEVANSDTSTVRAVRDGIGVGIDILRIRRRARRGVYPVLAADALPAPGTGGPQ